MVAVADPQSADRTTRNPVRVLYIGPYPDDLKQLFSSHPTLVAPSYTARAEDALFLSRNFDFEAVIVDQRDEALASRMILPLMACFNTPVRLIVLSELSEADAYKRIPGLAKLVPVPIREHALFRALGISQGAKPAPVAAKTDLKQAQSLPVAPRRARKLRSKRRLLSKKIKIRLPQLAAGLAILAVVLGTVFAWRAGAIPQQSTAVASSGIETDSALQQLQERIARTEVEKRRASDALMRSEQEVAEFKEHVRELQVAAAEPVEKLARSRGALDRQERNIEQAKSWHRSVIDLKQRHAKGLMDDDSLRLSALRILKADEDEHSLRLRRAELEKAGEDGIARTKVLQIIIDNLEGRKTALPQTVPQDLLPLIRKAAGVLQLRDRMQKELEATVRTLDIYLQKTRQLKQKASIVGSLARSCAGFAVRTKTCQTG